MRFGCASCDSEIGGADSEGVLGSSTDDGTSRGATPMGLFCGAGRDPDNLVLWF